MVMKTTTLLLPIIIAITTACNKPENKNAIDTYKDISIITTRKNKQISSIIIDTIFTNKKLSHSGDGFWKMRNDTFYYFDRTLAVVDMYNQNGIFQKRALGIGKGPGEVIEEICAVCNFNKGWLLTEVYNVYNFSRQFNDKKMRLLFKITENIEQRKGDLRKNPHPNKDFELYVPAYNYPQISQIDKNTVLMKVSCEYPDFMKQQYYNESAIVATYNFDKGTLTKLMGRYPPCYQKQRIAPAFSNYYYSSYKNNKYLLSFGIDSLIYICNNSFVPQKAFSISGDIVNDNYYTIDTRENGHHERINFFKELKTKGYYTSIYYCKQKDITFRVYKTGIKKDNIPDNLSEAVNPSRMQIYKGFTLIGDVPVPENFEIIGYNAPWFFADGYFDAKEDYDIIGFYKFKLE